MNDDIVVQKILKLLENNTAFIGYALNGGIGTKINVRNTETGKTIQALSINVDSTGEVLVVKDSEDNQYKAVTFKTAEKVSERIIQLRKTKPVDDKKTIEYTDTDIEVFYLFVKLIDTGSPVPTDLTSTWIRKGSSCTQFVGAYERCNYASKETIGGVSYTGLPYKPYETLQSCLDDDLGRDAKTPHGSKDENGANAGWKYYSTRVSAADEANMRAALESHDARYNTNYKKLFGYGTILECSGAMNLAGWEAFQDSQTGQYFTRCEFSYLPGYTLDCTPAMQAAGYCDSRGFINSKCPLPGQEQPNMPSVGGVDNSWGHQYGWKDLPYDFMYKRHFGQLYLNGSTAPGSFYILEVNDDQIPSNLPPDFFPWVPGCPSGGNGGPYDGSGGNRFPDGIAPIKKRDMKLSTHKAEIWLGSSKKETAIKLYELGASDLFSGMYSPFIIRADETRVDIENRLNRGFSNTTQEILGHERFYENWNKNRIDLKIDPRVWIYVIDNKPEADHQYNFDSFFDPRNHDLQTYIDNLYNRVIHLTVIDNKTQIVHLKLGLTPKNVLSNTDCKGTNNGVSIVIANDSFCGQSWEFQKKVTIKVENWQIKSTTNTLDVTDLEENDIWNVNHIKRNFITSFGTFDSRLYRHHPTKMLSRFDSNVSLSEVVAGNHFEQYNYNVSKLFFDGDSSQTLYIDNINTKKDVLNTDTYRRVGLGTVAWWELWNKTHYNQKDKRLSSIVGFRRNFYQILVSSGLSPTLNFIGYTSGGNTAGNTVTNESYFEYVPSRPLNYMESTISSVRKGTIPSSYTTMRFLKDRTQLTNSTGLYFYFGTWGETQWTFDYPFFLPFITMPSDYYLYVTPNELFSANNVQRLNTDPYNHNKRIETRRWINYLWAQLIYDQYIKVDVDSFKDVEFTPPTNPSQYTKYSSYYLYTNSEYSFTTQPQTTQSIQTVLTPGTLQVTKQVKITKPTNVDLDPNMSFILYIYPFVEVTKKKKTI